MAGADRGPAGIITRRKGTEFHTARLALILPVGDEPFELQLL